MPFFIFLTLDSFKKLSEKYNFYGISSTKENDGVYKFKKGFNGYVVELIGEFALPITYHFYLRKLVENYYAPKSEPMKLPKLSAEPLEFRLPK